MCDTEKWGENIQIGKGTSFRGSNFVSASWADGPQDAGDDANMYTAKFNAMTSKLCCQWPIAVQLTYKFRLIDLWGHCSGFRSAH